MDPVAIHGSRGNTWIPWQYMDPVAIHGSRGNTWIPWQYMDPVAIHGSCGNTWIPWQYIEQCLLWEQTCGSGGDKYKLSILLQWIAPYFPHRTNLSHLPLPWAPSARWRDPPLTRITLYILLLPLLHTVHQWAIPCALFPLISILLYVHCANVWL